ncbi:hypothetical protein KP509_31G066200 [Ceratopteris richardii]|uniref:Uncharacterized protein n=1 Tax=Ceratopteris richardii TaxID=49495 RepID=A0A8T2R0N7_CERRI|nr:hypothetical protein KP509_31G066200 [Ceratopteris richardii]
MPAQEHSENDHRNKNSDRKKQTDTHGNKKQHADGHDEHNKHRHNSPGSRSSSGNPSRSTSPVPGPTPVYEPCPIPPDLWTSKMLYVWKAAVEDTKDSKKKKLITIDTLAKHGENEKVLKLNSPRSIQACLELGVDPGNLVYRPVSAFQGKGLLHEFQVMKYEHHEKLRKEKIQKLQAERNRIIQKEGEDRAAAAAAAANRGPSNYHCPKDFQEKEKMRLEVVRRRQQRELEQMAKFEAQRQQMVADNEARAEAERKAEEQKRLEKARKDKEWQAEMRKRELQKMKEEEALEKKSKQLAAERYLREQQQLALEQQQLRKLKREAMRKEQERIAKQEEFRKQMEKIQEAQQEVLRKKQKEMELKDIERRRKYEEQNQERIRQHLEARKHAEARHATAVANFHELMRKREEDYQKRQEELRIKLKKQEEEHRIQEEEKKKREELKEQQRLEVIKEAQAERDRRVKELLDKAEAADAVLQNFIMRRQLEHARKVVESHMEFEDMHNKAESMRRVKAFHRYQILERIEEETDRVRRLLQSKQKQEDRRRAANVNLSIHRQSMLQQMEKLSISKKWRDTLSDADRAELEVSQKHKGLRPMTPAKERHGKKK